MMQKFWIYFKSIVKIIFIITLIITVFVLSFATPHHLGFYFVVFWCIVTKMINDLKKDLSGQELLVKQLKDKLCIQPTRVCITVEPNWERLYTLLKGKNLDFHKAFFIKGFGLKDFKQQRIDNFGFNVIHLYGSLSINSKILSYDTLYHNIWFDDCPEERGLFTFYILDNEEQVLCQPFSLFSLSSWTDHDIILNTSNIVCNMLQTIQHVHLLEEKGNYKCNEKDYTCKFNKNDVDASFAILAKNCYNSKFENDFITISISINEGHKIDI